MKRRNISKIQHTGNQNHLKGQFCNLKGIKLVIGFSTELLFLTCTYSTQLYLWKICLPEHLVVKSVTVQEIISGQHVTNLLICFAKWHCPLECSPQINNHTAQICVHIYLQLGQNAMEYHRGCKNWQHFRRRPLWQVINQMFDQNYEINHFQDIKCQELSSIHKHLSGKNAWTHVQSIIEPLLHPSLTRKSLEH